MAAGDEVVVDEAPVVVEVLPVVVAEVEDLVVVVEVVVADEAFREEVETVAAEEVVVGADGNADKFYVFLT